MPQERRRSISYRTFVTCDNPKGVVECGTIRKTKINSQKREQQHQQQSFKVVESDKRVGNSTTTNSSLGVIKDNKKEMCIQEITRELDLSKRGDKMNHVTNSWSKRKGDQEELITKDLLRGALDLKESLVMLGRLQEEALLSLVSRSRRKHKQKVEEGTFDCMVNGVSYEKLHSENQRPRKSVDGMKNAVRDSLLRQNVITNPIFEEHFDPRMTGFSDMPSTSSSHSSSMVRSSNFVPSESSSSSTLSQRRKKKESNLIVRLMGLESPPSSPSWHKQSENLVNLPKPMYDVDSPRARKFQFGAQVAGNKQQSVEEILETLHFKGLLRSNSVYGATEATLVKSESFPLKNEWYDERPPIVIMKPFGYPSRDLEEPTMPTFWLEGIKKPASRRQSVEETVTNSGANYFSEEGGKFVRKAGFERTKASVNRDQAPRKSSEVQKVSPTRRKGEEIKDVKLRDELRSCNQENLSNAPKMIKQKDGKHISRQQNVSFAAVHDHGKEEISKLSEQRKKIRQSSFVEENKKGKGKVKEIEVVSTYDNNNVLPKVKSIVFDSVVELNRPRDCQNQIRDYNVETLIECHQYDKPVCDISRIDSHSTSNGYDDSHSCYSEITSVSTSEHFSPVCEVTLVTTHENGLPVHSLVNKPPSFTHENEPESSKESHPSSTTKLQTLLLSNPSFLRNLEEVFDLQVFPNSVPYDIGRDRVLIDYANEVMKLKSSEFSHPFFPQTSKKTRNLPSLDQLLEGIKNGIEDLKHYHESASDDRFSSDYLYLKLERDLRFKSGIWEIGWRKLFSQDEVELVIRDIDKLIVGSLIEEVILDLLVI